MATIKPNAIGSAVSQLVNGQKPETIKPRNTQRVKDQGNTAVTWDVAQARLSAAVKSEGDAHNKWTSASDTLWILGVRPAHLEPVEDGKGKLTESETFLKVKAMVIKGFTPRVQSLLAASGAMLSGLSESERGDKRYWTKRIPVMMGRVLAYLKRHEDNERGVSEKKLLSDMVVKVLKVQKGRLQKADAEKIKDIANLDRVYELFDELIAELS